MANSPSFFFYDLETSGFSPREARIMQFAGQRTDMNLQPIGEPVNLYIRLTPDILPDLDAVLLTGITPQKTLEEGLTEAEFLEYFYANIVQPATTFVGYNSIRFDDEFMRFLQYRNLYDAYEWQWTNECSRWDLLDVVRMTRALRPDGIKWPTTIDGKATNRLELLTQANNLDHLQAHDALSDVHATIALATLIHKQQPDLFSYLLQVRHKKKVSQLVEAATPFVYTSSHYSGETLHTSAVVLLVKHPKQDSALVYDLRFDPTQFLAMDIPYLIQAWKYSKDPDHIRLPVKTLKYNRCPAVAPLGVMADEASQSRLQLTIATVTKNLSILKKQQVAFSEKMLLVLDAMDSERQKTETTTPTSASTVDGQLYDGFFDSYDKDLMRLGRTATPEALTDLTNTFHDLRLQQLLPRYKARNYPKKLTSEERQDWDNYLKQKLLAGGKDSALAVYFDRLAERLSVDTITSDQRYVLEELRLYGESIAPVDEAD